MSRFSVDGLFYDPETGISRDLIGLRELSERLDVCYRTLLRAIHSGRLQAVAVGRQWKVWRDALISIPGTATELLQGAAVAGATTNG